jgi:hypothetical protein
VTLNKRWTIFSTRNIYNDLMKIQQGLIDNNYPKQRKPIGTSDMQIIRSRSCVDYLCINLAMFGFINVYIEIYEGNDNKVKLSR